MTNWDLAEQIYKDLNKKGAGLGNASIPFIEKTLDKHLPKIIKSRTDNNQYSGEDSKAMKDYEFNLHQHWKDDKRDDNDDDGHGGTIKHFQD